MNNNQPMHKHLPDKRKWLKMPDPRILLFSTALLFSQLIVSAQLPAGFTAKRLNGITTADKIDGGISLAHAPDGRIFIIERKGNLRVLKANGTTPIIHTVTTTVESEQGLLGVALHNNFAQNGKCYLYYTNAAKTTHRLDVVVINADNTIASSTNLMEFDPIDNGSHNGGAMVFKDNYLYLCIGESNYQANAQNLDT